MLVCIDVCMHAVICGISLGQWRAGARVYVGRLGIITWPRERARARESVCVCVYVCVELQALTTANTDGHARTRSRTGEHHSKAAD